jgi:hypothetical protein
MAIDFPASPTLNDVFTVGNVTYVWDGTKWTASVTGGISLDKIEEGNTSAEVIDTGSDGRFVVTTEGTERLRVTDTGLVGIGTSSPTQPLHVVGRSLFQPATGTRVITLVNTSGADGSINVSGGATSMNYGFHTYSTADALYIQNDGKVGIGTTSPGYPLHVFSSTSTVGIRVDGGGDSIVSFANAGSAVGAVGIAAGNIAGGGSGNIGIQSGSSLLFATGGVNEKARIDSSGRLLIGTSSSASAGDTQYARLQVQGNTFGGGGSDAIFGLRANLTAGTNISSGSGLGRIIFSDTNGATFGQIECAADGTVSSASDLPGRLTFSTTADGASSPTERLRIDSSGRVGIGTTSPVAKLTVVSTSSVNGVNNCTLRSSDNATSSFYIGHGPSGVVNIASDNNIGFGYTNNTTYTERMRLDTSGRLLVGTSTAGGTELIQVQGVSGSSTAPGGIALRRSSIGNTDDIGFINFQNASGNTYAQIKAFADGVPGAGDYPGALMFATTANGASSPTERMRITNSGYTIHHAPGWVLEVATAAASGTTDRLIYGVSERAAAGAGGGNQVFIVYSNGNVVNFNNSYGSISDIKLKENIVDAHSQWDDLKALQVRNYNFKEGQTHTQIGLVAQEVELVSPGLVSESPDRDEDGNDLGTVTKSVNYSVLYMKAVKALQEAMERIETLEGMVAVNNITIDEQQHQLSTLAARLTALESA